MNQSTNIRIGIANRLGNLGNALYNNGNLDLQSVRNEVGAIYHEIGSIEQARQDEKQIMNSIFENKIKEMRDTCNNDKYN